MVNLAVTLTLVVGLWSVVDSGSATWAALSGTTGNAGNTFQAGDVKIHDNDGGTNALITFTNKRPGDIDNRCIHLSYTGTLSATVKMYASVSGLLADHINVTVTRGTQSSPSFGTCTGFTADAINYGMGNGIVYQGTLSGLPSTYATGVTDPVAGWTSATSATYRFTVSLADVNAAQGQTSGATFTWEARS